MAKSDALTEAVLEQRYRGDDLCLQQLVWAEGSALYSQVSKAADPFTA